MFKDLSSIWQETFTEAWTALCEGSIPIGAIITDTEGRILSRGRNSIFSTAALNPRMKHAEIVCMSNLDTEKYPAIRDYILYTTMEPCPMCMGTLTMVNIRHVRYAAHDDYCGAAHLAFDEHYISRKKIDISFDDTGMEAVQIILQTYFDFIRYGKAETNKVIECFKTRCPECFTVAKKVYDDGSLQKDIDNKVPAEEVFDRILALYNEAHTLSTSMLFTARIEQTKEYEHRMKYIAETDSFIAKDCISLSYARNVPEPYGWLVESGNPPHRHLDVIVMTDKSYELGDTENVRVIGVFCRCDNDNKLVAVPVERDIYDYSELSDTEKEDMHRLYPKEEPGEGWFGAEKAREIIDAYYSNSKAKTIYLIQHCESEHHLNGMIGAWTDWNLTERGREQASVTGKWLLEKEFAKYEGCHIPNAQIYCSTLNRARQTADGLLEYLNAPITYSDAIREVSAGAAHGKSCEWNRADADSDRDLWARIRPFYLEILNSDKQNIFVVSHGTTLSFLQTMLMGHTDVSIRAKFNPQGPAGSVSKFVISDSGQVRPIYLNRLAF